MAGQEIERRDILRVLAYASAAAGFAGFSRWAFGGQEPHQRGTRESPSTTINSSQYQPQFLANYEYKTLERLTDIIIPRDDSPGALDAGVAEFIDFMLAHDPEVSYSFRLGLVWLEAHAVTEFGHNFSALTPKEQISLLRPLAYATEFRPGSEEGRSFFKLARRYTVMGFYTSRIGMEELGCPSLRTMYPGSPSCPHPNDPEHKHLAAPENHEQTNL
jgi:gluconate 2-dehydrogenase subunit 3-like protein